MIDLFLPLIAGIIIGHVFTAYHAIYIVAVPLPREKTKDDTL